MLEKAITPKTRLIVANSPNNPSGAVIDDEEYVRIARLCKDRDIYLLDDECYAYFLYDGRKPFSIASLPEFKSHVIIAGSLSKTYAMTGWRDRLCSRGSGDYSGGAEVAESLNIESGFDRAESCYRSADRTAGFRG